MLHKHLLPAFFFCNALTAFSQSAVDTTAPEKKVDYLEKIYFSGGTKSDLTDMITLDVQKMEAQFDSTKLPSAAFIKQYVFLKGIEPQLPNAKDACDVVDLLAVGIRTLDMEEAMAQKIKQPSPEAAQHSAGGIDNINKVNNAISTTNSSLNTLAWNSYLLTGKVGGLGTLNTVSSVTNSVGAGLQAAQAGKQVFDVAKGLGLLKGKDKPCKEVEKKDIEIGYHKFTPAPKPTDADVQQYNAANKPASGGSRITINNITYNKLSTLRPLIAKITGVNDVSVENFNNNTAILKILHGLELDELLANMTQLSSSVKLEVTASDAKSSSGTLVCK